MSRSYKLSDTGKIAAETAYEEAEWSKYEQLASAADCTRQSVGRYFAGEPISKCNFKKISKLLGLKWQDLVQREGKDLERENICQANNQQQSSAQSQAIVVIGGELVESNKIKINNEVIEVEVIIARLEASYQLKLIIQRIEEGSVKITLGGSPEDLENLQELFSSGELNEVLGIPIEDIQTVSQTVEGQSLSDADLGGANLGEPNSGHLGDLVGGNVPTNQAPPPRNSRRSFRNRRWNSPIVNSEVRWILFFGAWFLIVLALVFLFPKLNILPQMQKYFDGSTKDRQHPPTNPGGVLKPRPI